MPDISMSPMVAVMIFFAALAAIGLLLSVMWAASTHQTAAPNKPLTGRRAAAYWDTPTGVRDERGITERPRVPHP